MHKRSENEYLASVHQVVFQHNNNWSGNGPNRQRLHLFLDFYFLVINTFSAIFHVHKRRWLAGWLAGRRADGLWGPAKFPVQHTAAVKATPAQQRTGISMILSLSTSAMTWNRNLHFTLAHSYVFFHSSILICNTEAWTAQ
jgi:hypothetical protein